MASGITPTDRSADSVKRSGESLSTPAKLARGATLPRLPPELIELIATFIRAPSDRMNFRRVNDEFSLAVFKARLQEVQPRKADLVIFSDLEANTDHVYYSRLGCRALEEFRELLIKENATDRQNPGLMIITAGLKSVANQEINKPWFVFVNKFRDLFNKGTGDLYPIDMQNGSNNPRQELKQSIVAEALIQQIKKDSSHKDSVTDSAAVLGLAVILASQSNAFFMRKALLASQEFDLEVRLRAFILASNPDPLDNVKALLAKKEVSPEAKRRASEPLSQQERELAVILASQAGAFDIVQALLEKKEPISTKAKDEALIAASQAGALDIVQALSQRESPSEEVSPGVRGYAVILAARNMQSQIVEYLLTTGQISDEDRNEAAYADLDTSDAEYDHPLALPIVEALFKSGEITEYTRSWGARGAARRKNLELLKIFLAKGSILDEARNDAIQEVFESFQGDVEPRDFEIEIVEALASNGDISTETIMNATEIFLYLDRKRDPRILEVLLEKEECFIESKEIAELIELATQAGYHRIVELLQRRPATSLE